MDAPHPLPVAIGLCRRLTVATDHTYPHEWTRLQQTQRVLICPSTFSTWAETATAPRCEEIRGGSRRTALAAECKNVPPNQIEISIDLCNAHFLRSFEVSF